ncbi:MULTISPECIES: isopenicillin N synthase family oxygenase [Microbacterium]|uniref:isopenicillin N synthase family dioxygenase n=1 Tax=Microbacterium TaxID=33882 RepID=UPI00277E4625|nr:MULTISPECIES: 2-oxoglutarate and iron-dependent oxygenase domain-containing protein [Microbacterium]MDQ1084332.1 isopenicillin N synthase-like dioxygenase [Microbacterium sp. SORGH_AS_0344]MDQ1170392.1 isopenicillin N synthase-like dioxygenase [Microbacterium proteolyticum]
MPPFAVPKIDISAWVGPGSPDARAAVVAAVDHACRTVGFMQIVGHGIPDAVITDFTEALDDFFALPLDAKKQYVRPSGENRGYSPPKSESLSYSLGVDPVTRMNDFFEAFNVGTSAAEYPGSTATAADYAENTWPTETTTFEPAVTAYYDEARRVAHTLTRIFAAALRVREDFFDDVTDHSIDVLRMNNYALPPGSIELGAELTGMGEHTDFGLVTVLWADQVKGLQVLGQDGSWNDVAPADGALLVNLGDVAARLTNDKWMSTLHRVKPPIIDGTIERRRSAAFFHDGNADAVIAPLPGFVTAESPALYDPVTVSEHIAAKLGGSRAGRKNVSAVREAARLAGTRG